MKKISFKTPITRGNQVFEAVEVREPLAGDLRGLSMAQVFNMDTDAIIKLSARITSPAILEHEIAALSLGDFTAIALAIVGYLNDENLDNSLKK